jgi:hypothetical protein
MRDHVINTSDDSSSKTAQVRKVYETLLAHRDVVCRPQDTVAAKDLVRYDCCQQILCALPKSKLQNYNICFCLHNLTFRFSVL